MARLLSALCSGLASFVLLAATASGSVASAESPRVGRAADDLVVAVADRLALAVSVAAAKHASGAAVDDPVREAAAAEAFVVATGELGIPDAAARRVITASFEASKAEQRSLLAQWQARPETAPVGAPPNLVTQVRPAIDATTLRLAGALAGACRAHDRDPRAWARAMEAAAAAHRPRWRWQRQALTLALEPVRTDPCAPSG